MRILLVENDLIAAKDAMLMLRAAGAVVDQCELGEEGLALAQRYEYDIILLELTLHDLHGFDVISRLRTNQSTMPILVVSAHTPAQVKVKCLGLGADDFITKPYDKAELLARMQAMVRRSKGGSQPLLQTGPIELNRRSREVWVGGKQIHLTGREFAVLELLMLRKGVAITKEAIMNHLYGGVHEPDLKIIDVFVCKLRKKLAQTGAADMISTIRGRGHIIREATHVAQAEQDLSPLYLPGLVVA